MRQVPVPPRDLAATCALNTPSEVVDRAHRERRTLQGGAGTKSYHKLSMDHTKCKNAKHPGDNLAEWVPGT